MGWLWGAAGHGSGAAAAADNWQQVVEELIPFGIAQLCFFDAEKIRFLAEDDTSSEALGVAIKSVLGLDLAERLIVERYFPNASHQVIILSTDTEIERNYFDQLKGSIARAYLLNYDEATKSTVPIEGYFWGSEPANCREEAAV